jgi:hypothetical protein
VQEQQVLIILQKIIQHLIILTTLIKITHPTEAPQVLAIAHLLLQEVVQVVALLVAADLLAAAEQEVAAAINHAKKINAGLNDISII